MIQPSNNKLKTYIDNLTKADYELYPTEMEKIVEKNIHRFALDLIEKIKTNPQRECLRVPNIVVAADSDGYALIRDYLSKQYKVVLSELSPYTPAVDVDGKTHVLLNSIKPTLMKISRSFTVSATFKADNPSIFPKQKVLQLVAPEYSLQVHALTEWQKAQKGEGTNIEIVVDGVNFKAHKMKLVMHSEYFRVRLEFANLDKKEEKVWNLEDLSALAFGHFLKFIYTGTLEEITSIELISEMIHASSVYRVLPLDGICCNQLVALLQKYSCTAAELDSLFASATTFPDSHLLKVCLDFVQANQNMENCLLRSLDTTYVPTFLKLAKERKLEFVEKKILKWMKYNSTMLTQTTGHPGAQAPQP